MSHSPRHRAVSRILRNAINTFFGTGKARTRPMQALPSAQRSHMGVEPLEGRLLLSYTFALVGATATVSPAATGGPILIDEVLVAGNPLLEWSQDGGVTFSTDWDSATPGTQVLPAGGVTLTIDLSNDGLPHVLDLSSDGTTSTLHDELGNLPIDITYITQALSSLNIDADGTRNQTLNVNFGGGGNPIPSASSPGLIFNAGDPALGGSHALNIFGQLPSGPFASEIHNANDQTVFPQVGQYGSISFDDGTGGPVNPDNGQGGLGGLTSLWYTGLQPINDTTPAVNYTFNDFATDQSFTAQNGPVVLGFQTIQFANTPAVPPPTFETTNIANKNFVVLNTPLVAPPTGLTGVVNITTPSTGLLSLMFNTPTDADNQVGFLDTPPGVVTSLNGGADEDTTDVAGNGVAAGTVLFLNGGAAADTLNYDAGGLNPTVTPGLLPGEVLITVPGSGIVDVIGYEAINITDVGPLTITPGPARFINSVEGFDLADAIVGAFTLPLAPIASPPPGLPAGDFTATIDWGNPSVDPSAGTITQDASNPSLYYITGTHTFAAQGTFVVANTVVFFGGAYSSTVNGVPVSVTLSQAGPTVGTPAIATVVHGTLAVSVFPIVGTEGVAIAAGPIATFIDAGGADSIGAYSATISIINSAGATVISVAAASITQNGNAAEYTVNAPVLTLSEEGTYRIVVAVTDSDGPTPLTVSGAATAIIADASLTAGAAVALTPNTGATLPATTVVGSFTDANTAAPVSDFTAIIDWGDGSPTTLGTIVSTGGGGFNVQGTHAYARPGSYITKVNVTDNGGSTVTLNGTATVTDLPVTGAVRNFPAVEGQDTGSIVLATFSDPNPLATASDLTATLPVGGWGDGTPGAPVVLAITQIGGTATSTLFAVLGNHKYAEEGTYTVNINVTTRGGVTTALTPATATVIDAALSSSNGTEITGIEGNTTGTVLLGSFRDANQGATAADFTTAPGSVVVNWGDGSAPQTLAAANLTAIGSPDGAIFSVSAAHTYTEAGTYAYTVIVTDDGGSVTVFGGSAIIADAALTAAATPGIVSAEGASTGTVTVGTFTDANPNPTSGDFSAVIDWGDGSPTSFGAFSIIPGVGGGPATVAVRGTHVYKEDGTFTITALTTDVGGQKVTTTATANVSDPAATGVAAIPVNATAGEYTGQIAVAIFTDPNPYSSASDWNTTINWGDGSTPDTGNVVLVGGAIGGGNIFKVFGSHNYVAVNAGASPPLTAVIVTLDDVDTPANDTVVTGPIANVTIAPQRPTIDLIDSFDSGSSDKDNITNIVPEQYRVSAEPGATVVIKDGETVIDTFVMPVTADGFTTRR